LELASNDAAEPAADRSEISVGRGLNDQANAVSGDVREIARLRGPSLTCWVSRKPGQQAQNDGNEEKRTTRHAFKTLSSWGSTTPSSAPRHQRVVHAGRQGESSSARIGPVLKH